MVGYILKRCMDVVFFLFACLAVAGCGTGGENGNGNGPAPPPPITTIGSLELSIPGAPQGHIIAGEENTAAVRAVVRNITGEPLGGVSVEFSTSSGSFSGSSEAVANTNADGIAQVMLSASNRAGQALVTAQTSGFSDSSLLAFVAGTPVAANSSISVQPAVLPPDGESEATVTVTLADGNGNPVEDGTWVRLYSSLGTILENDRETASGRVEFQVRAGYNAGTATINLQNFSHIAGSDLVIGSLGPGKPSSILVTSITQTRIAVTGVGEPDNTRISVRVVDEFGVPVPDPSDANVRVSFLAHPGGGLILNGNPDSVHLATENGYANFNLRSGIRPGVVELKVEAFDGIIEGSPMATAVFPRISIASGPPHTIALSAPSMNAIVDLTNGDPPFFPPAPGFYSRRVGLIVTDRYGNSVPDGTVLNIGVLDSVIASGEEGSISMDIRPEVFSQADSDVDFMNDYIVRNSVPRYIEPGDRVVIFNARAEDKSRFVESRPTFSHRLDISRPYHQDSTSLHYAVGASLLGTAVYGISDGEATVGTVFTKNGLGEIRMVYPAEAGTIHLGGLLYQPGSYTVLPEPLTYDPRFDVATPSRSSARVILVATSSDDSASLVDERTLMFSSVAPWQLGAKPEGTVSQSRTITLTLKDGGDGIRLPYVPIRAIVDNRMGAPVVSAQHCVTSLDGTCTSRIVVTGNSGDEATVIYTAGDAEPVEVFVEIP